MPIYFCVTAVLECCRSWRTSSIFYPLFIYIWVAKYFRKLCVEIPDNPIYSQAAFKCFYICRSDKSKSCCCLLMRFLMRYWSINSLISSGTVKILSFPVLISEILSLYLSPSLMISQNLRCRISLILIPKLASSVKAAAILSFGLHQDVLCRKSVLQ